MKKVTKFFMAALLAGVCSFGYPNNRLSDSYSSPENLYVQEGYYNYFIYESGDPGPFESNFNRAMKSALQNIPEGAKFAIDQIMTDSDNGWHIEKLEVHDYVVDYLLDNGFSVVAKQHLEKLFEEQQTQQSGIFNEKTIAKENNFSGVGFYISVKIKSDRIRVHVINVSTGEYVGSGSNYY